MKFFKKLKDTVQEAKEGIANDKLKNLTGVLKFFVMTEHCISLNDKAQAMAVKEFNEYTGENIEEYVLCSGEGLNDPKWMLYQIKDLSFDDYEILYIDREHGMIIIGDEGKQILIENLQKSDGSATTASVLISKVLQMKTIS
ncbi:MAG: hypothetical protein FWC70_05185 [Defluviitaleaceae bacterium]|nr:hypothetical protein [Defluviitaleaceae bacterium]